LSGWSVERRSDYGHFGSVNRRARVRIKVSVHLCIKCPCDLVGWRDNLAKVASWWRLSLRRAEGAFVAVGGPRVRRKPSRVGCPCPRLGSDEARSRPLNGPILDLIAPIRPLQLCADGGYQLRFRSLEGTPNYGPRQSHFVFVPLTLRSPSQTQTRCTTKSSKLWSNTCISDMTSLAPGSSSCIWKNGRHQEQLAKQDQETQSQDAILTRWEKFVTLTMIGASVFTALLASLMKLSIHTTRYMSVKYEMMCK
jgi:hypothetical protein